MSEAPRSYRCARCDFTHDDAGSEDVRQHAWVTPRHPRCICCGRSLPLVAAQTCLECVGRVKAALTDITDGYGRLDDVIENSGWRQLNVTALAYAADGSLQGGGPDDWPSDPTPVIAVLEANERHWRHEFGQPPAVDVATVAGCAAYLQRHIDRAAQQLADFDDFAGEIRRLRSGLTHTAGTANDPMRAATDCLDCGGRLVCDYEPPRMAWESRVSNAHQALRAAIADRRREQQAAEAANEQARRERLGTPDDDLDLTDVPLDLALPELRMVVTAAVLGRSEEGLHSDHADGFVQPLWRCSRCHRTYTSPEYRLAQRTAIDGVDGWVTVAVASEQTGRSDQLVRYWASTGKVSSRLIEGRLVVKLVECRALVPLRGRKIKFGATMETAL